ncbi:probable transcription factor At1g11510 [Salvia miltiorrhiza]|uniref:probable transcription factor At1g11510 n=1 Tax=Salvia miltiorrhiza TaxID=226208 RepID=UPI0025AC6C93|nr:probable transcription factor At1g11510 [Salvia miltiorrhiza]
MTRNREPARPAESQSESDDEIDSQDSDSEPEPSQIQTATQKKSQPPPPAPSSSEEEDSGSESESESDGPDPNVRPLASKPVEEAQKSSNGTKKARSTEPVTPTKSATAKRAAEDTADKDAKKSKKASAEPEVSEKKSNLFQRLWSEEDEIVILKGMIDYTSKNKSDPISDLNAFHDFIKKNLHIDVTRTQLQDKIRRLKKKYENNKSKEKEGKERTFSKPHEQSAYDLSKAIWGNETGKEIGGVKLVNGSVVRKAASKKVNAAESEEVKNAAVMSWEGEEKRVNSYVGGATMEERMLITGGEVFGLGRGGVEGEKEWQKLRLEELQLYLKQLEVKVAQTKLVLGAIKGRDH